MIHARKLAAAFTSCGAGLVSKAAHTLPDASYCRLIHLLRTGRILHLKNPRTYAEKIQWLKLYGHLDGYAPYVDKYAVRDYIAATIGAGYLVPLLGVWQDFDEIPLGELPEQFVLKATHGTGYVVVCQDKSSLDLADLRATVNGWMNTNYFRAEREPQYRAIRPRLVAEAYLEDDSGGLRDYKFTCFDGVAYMLEVFSDRASAMKVNQYDRHWNLLPVRAKGWPNTAGPIPKPDRLDEMFDIAARLSAGFPLVRVDLYHVNGRVYFGELTFTPNNGAIRYEPASFNRDLAAMLDLSGLMTTAGSGPGLAGSPG